jgi:hypothetical protein
LARFQRNPTNISICIALATLYFKGEGTFQDIPKAKVLFKKAHLRKLDECTFGLLACIKKMNETKEFQFEICLQRKDTFNPKLLFRIGKGLIERNEK